MSITRDYFFHQIRSLIRWSMLKPLKVFTYLGTSQSKIIFDFMLKKETGSTSSHILCLRIWNIILVYSLNIHRKLYNELYIQYIKFVE